MAQYVDRTLMCCDCQKEFLFSAGEQQFFAMKKFRNEPKRCKPCKEKRAAEVSPGSFVRHDTIVTCELCGKQTTLPFRPTQGRPVYCRECFQTQPRA